MKLSGSKKIILFQKLFGSLTYDQSMNVPKEWLPFLNSDETFRKTENNLVNSGLI